jgi:heat shock protein HslJ
VVYDFWMPPKIFLVTAALASVFFVAGCAPATTQVSGTWGDTSQQSSPSLELGANGALAGTDGCNRLVGEYQATTDEVIFEQVASTMMFCEEIDTWLSRLSTATVNENTMTIFDKNGVEIGTLTRNK